VEVCLLYWNIERIGFAIINPLAFDFAVTASMVASVVQAFKSLAVIDFGMSSFEESVY